MRPNIFLQTLHLCRNAVGETSHRTPQRREMQQKIILKGDDSLQLVVPAMVTLTARFEEAQADGDVARKLQQGCLECHMRLVRLLGQGHELATGNYIEAAFLHEMMWPSCMTSMTPLLVHHATWQPMANMSAVSALDNTSASMHLLHVKMRSGNGKNNGWPSGSACPWADSKTHALVCFSFSLVRGAMRLDPLGMADNMYDSVGGGEWHGTEPCTSS